MVNQEVDLLKEEVEMLSSQVRQQCSVIKETSKYLTKLHGFMLEDDVDYMKSPMRYEVDNVLERTNLCK